MRVALKAHPESRCEAVEGIDVEIARPDAASLVLTYVLTGDPTRLRMPPVTASSRADRLWEHSCFEAFLGPSTRDEYYEFNFAPSTRWAAYRFSGYRQGMCIAEEVAAPRIDVHAGDTGYTLEVSLGLERLPGLPGDGPWRLGLSAVIEETNGRQSLWAVAHPPGQADFHHRDCFALELPAA